MKIVVKHHKGLGSEIYNDAVKLRTMVFVEEQKISARLEIDENEDIASYVVVYENGQPVSTGRYRETEIGIKMERFATLPEFRGKGMGRIVVNAILKEILPLKKTIYLHSQESAVEFYLKNGFILIGEPFSEAGIRHYKMVYGL
jgi:predicted GNAT family N-acyltransferase